MSGPVTEVEWSPTSSLERIPGAADVVDVMASGDAHDAFEDVEITARQSLCVLLEIGKELWVAQQRHLDRFRDPRAAAASR